MEVFNVNFAILISLKALKSVNICGMIREKSFKHDKHFQVPFASSTLRRKLLFKLTSIESPSKSSPHNALLQVVNVEREAA